MPKKNPDAEERKEETYTVVHETDIPIMVALGVTENQKLITFVHQDLTYPITIAIMEKDYSLEKEKEMVREEVEKAKAHVGTRTEKL